MILQEPIFVSINFRHFNSFWHFQRAYNRWL